MVGLIVYRFVFIRVILFLPRVKLRLVCGSILVCVGAIWEDPIGMARYNPLGNQRRVLNLGKLPGNILIIQVDLQNIHARRNMALISNLPEKSIVHVPMPDSIEGLKFLNEVKHVLVIDVTHRLDEHDWQHSGNVGPRPLQQDDHLMEHPHDCHLLRDRLITSLKQGLDLYHKAMKLEV
jgi:hypothetical protein